MRIVCKGVEPGSLRLYKRSNPNARYEDLSPTLRADIREACVVEQFYLCAYCCQQISGESTDTMNEHVEARKLAPSRSLDFTNIVASCRSAHQCDSAHGSQHLPLTPFMDACEREFEFGVSGRVKGSTERAKEAIRVLNLGDKEENNRRLIEMRKQLSYTLLLATGIDPDEGLDCDELLEVLIVDLSSPREGRLEPFAPVVVSILRRWLSA